MTEPNPTISQPSSGSLKVFFIALLAICLIVGAVWLHKNWNKGDEDGQPTEKISSERVLELEQMAVRANGFLEIQQQDAGSADDGTPRDGFVESIKLYEQLHLELPDEPMPIRNLAIARTLRLLHGIPESDLTDEIYQQTVRSIRKLQESEPNSALPYYLLAAIREKGEDFSQAIDSSLADLRQARKLEPDSAVANWAFIQAAELAGQSDELSDEIDDAYATLQKVAGDNIEFLKTYPVYLARKKDPQLAAFLKESRNLLQIAGKMQAIEKASPASDPENRILQNVDNAIVAIEKNDWRKALQLTMESGNLMNGLAIQKLDYKALAPHFLDYIDYSFSEKFYARAEPVDPVPAKEESFSEMFSSGNSTEVPVSFKTFAPVDFNRDTKPDLVGISEQRLVVVAQSDLTESDRAQWKTFLEYDLKGDFHGLFAVDLDRDRQPDEQWAGRMTRIAADAKRSRMLAEEHADPDVIVYGKDGLKILLNEQEQLKEVAQSDAIAGIKGITAAALVDLEADSDLDLVVAANDGTHVLLNAGNLQFIEFSESSVLPQKSLQISAMQIVDWDRDADIDIVVCTKSSGVGILENLLHGRFRWRFLGGDFEKLAGVDMKVAEVDGNASWDLVVASEAGVHFCLTSTIESRVNSMQVITIGDDSTSSTSGFLAVDVGDLDNNSYNDLVSWDHQSLQVFKHQAGNQFGEKDGRGYDSVEIDFGELGDIQHCETADFDLDGDLDLIVSTGHSTRVFTNELKANNYLTVIPIGIDEGKGRVNHNGIGSLIELSAGGRYQAQVITSPTVHFGLGELEQADLLRIVWTNGVPQPVVSPSADVVIREVMFEISSCPFIYVWNGKEFEFFSDCLWAAPIGLQLAEGVLAPTRAWEYLKIPGELMKPDGDYYSIQLTEELWEAAYFDHVELIAVDHPNDVDIFTNEKVGPPNIAEHKIFAVEHKRPPLKATDMRGHDVLAKVLNEDEVYMQGFERSQRKGLTPEHYLELDLGELGDSDASKSIVLFLTGWIRPSDSSLNVHFSQHPNLKGAVPPQLYVPDGDGGWKIAIAPMGFPGGKTKTIAIDLSSVFERNDYRLRIQTSNEIYWDHAFFAFNEPEHPIKTTMLPVEAADLHYRGFSRSYFINEQSPELFDYRQTDIAPRWPPMRGNFTRYGEVASLLNDQDDQLVVLGSGDEMTVRFRVPEGEIPAGWKRDFILHSVGYDKDANLNTILGQSTEPLPFVEMTGYPIPTGEEKPETDEYRDYLKTYQIRRQNWFHYWRQILNYEGTENRSITQRPH